MYQFWGLLHGEKGPKNSGMGNHPPLFGAMPERKRAFPYDVFPKPILNVNHLEQ